MLVTGNNNVLVIYNGNENFTISRNSTNFTIEKADSLVNVTAESIVYGNVSEIVVKVPRVQKGYVTITINGNNLTAPIVNGVAKFNVSGLNAGEYVVNVTYLGDENYAVVKNSTTLNVLKNNITATVIAQNVTVENNPSFITDITRDFNGKVNITIDGKPVYDGDFKSLIIIDKLLAGNYTANVTFYGDDNYNNKYLLVDFTVSRVTPVIDIDSPDVTYPSNVTASITISNKANGTVEIVVDCC